MKFSLITILVPFLLLACKPCNSKYQYSTPITLNDGLVTGVLEQVNIDSSLINKAINKITSGKFNEIHSFLIYKDDKLVLEKYFNGYKYQWNAPNYRGEFVQWNAEMMHPVMSCAKSFTSAFIGIAIDHGYIKSVEESIFNYLPDHQLYRTAGKEDITIEHLLSMTSGLAWNEWGAAHGSSANDIDRLYFDCSDDPIKCVLEREMIHQPGTVFTYNGGGVVMLGEILKNATNMDVNEFSMKYLFEPLGVDSTYWFQYNNGVYATDGSLYLKPRDMLKLGVTYLNKGKYNDAKVIAEEWVDKSFEVFNNNKDINIPIEDSGSNSYGYLWWISELDHHGKPIKMYRANGWGGQTIMVFPDLNMVVVFTCGNYASKSKLFKILNKYVLPAVKD